jgi:CRISPR-associated endoribonuclease Cas6
MVELLSLVLNLQPLQPYPNDQPAPLWWGRAIQAAVLKTLSGLDPALNGQLHDEAGLRPYTVSNLLGHFPKRQLDLQGEYTLRLAGLSEAVSTLLMNATTQGSFAPGAELELDFTPFRILAAITDPQVQPWADQAGYASLSQALVGDGTPPGRKFQFQLASPLVFHSQDRSQPLPLPGMFFGSLLERWNAFAPIAFPPETRRYAEEMLAVSRFDLESRAIPMKSGGLRVGAVGKVQFCALNADRYWLGILHTLAAFAKFSGAGTGTTQGLGQCRSIPGEHF